MTRKIDENKGQTKIRENQRIEGPIKKEDLAIKTINKKAQKKVRSKSLIILLLLIGVSISSCDPIKEIHQFHSIPAQGWSKTDTLEFTLPTLENSKLYLDIQIRSTQAYPYRDLYLLCEENLSDSLQIQKDTLHINLADSTGRWEGSGLGYYYQSSYFYKTIPHTPQSEQACIKISSLMRDSLLPGISDIGIHIY